VRDLQALGDVLHRVALPFGVVACRGRADAAGAGLDLNAEPRGVVLHLPQVVRLQALIIVEARKLDGVELQGGGIIEQLDGFPAECAEGVGIEPELDAFAGQGGWDRGDRGGRLQEGIEFNNEKTEMNVYQAPVMSKEKSKEYAEKFYDNREFDTSSMEIDTYQEEAVYWVNRKYSLWLKYLDGTYRYTDFSEFDEGKEHMSCEEDKLKELLIGYGIHLPGQAVFEEVAAGKYQWKINKYTEGDFLTEGSLSCEYYNDNTIKSIDNNIVVYRKVKTTAIISQKEAYQQLADGKFQIWTNGNNLKTMVITAIELDYQLDTKGFYQPVYLFDTVVNGTETTITIPALRQ
jgi:hypothetical protein